MWASESRTVSPSLAASQSSLSVVEVDTDVLPLTPGDRLVVCCDGLWEMIRDEGIEDVMMQEADPQAACDLLVKHANMAGGEDNISVIVVQVEAA